MLVLVPGWVVVRVEPSAGVALDGAERLPGDAQDDSGHDQANDRVTGVETESDEDRARDDERLTKPSVRACAPSAIIAGLSSRRPTRVRIRAAISLPMKPTTPAAANGQKWPRCCGSDQPLDRLPKRNAGTEEDRCDDEVAGALLGHEGAHQEGDPQRHRRQRVSEVVDQVGKQRDAAREHEHSALQERW